MSNEMVVVVAGGEAPEPDAARAVPAGAPVVAADRGLDHALALGLDVTVAVGDFDSASRGGDRGGGGRGNARSSAIPRRRTRPTSSSRSTRRSRSSRSGSSCSPASASGSTTSSRRCCSSAPIAVRGVELDARIGAARVHVIRGRAQARGHARRARLALRAAAARRRACGPRARLPARRRDARAGLEPRRLERVRAERRASSVERGSGARRATGRGGVRRPSDRLSQGRVAALPRSRSSPPALTACGGGGDAPTSVVLVTHDSFVDLGRREAGVRAESGLGSRSSSPATRARRSRRRSSPRGTPRATSSSASTATSSRARSRATSSSRTSRQLLEDVPERYRLDPEHRATPIDHGEVCLNYDRTWFAERDLAPPAVARRSHRARVRGAARRREPGDLDPGPRVPARDDRALRRGRLAGLLARGCARTTCSSSTAGRRRTTCASRARPAGSGERPVVVSYASSPRRGGDLPQPAARARADRRSSRTAASARSSSPESSAAPGTRTARGS